MWIFGSAGAECQVFLVHLLDSQKSMGAKAYPNHYIRDPVSIVAMGTLAPMGFWESHKCTKKTWHSAPTDPKIHNSNKV